MRCPPCPSPTLAARNSSAANWSNSSSRRARKAPTHWPWQVVPYAGAMGYGQFMPSSFTKYAVDSLTAMGISTCGIRVTRSAASPTILKQHGWVNGDRVAVPASGWAPRWRMASRRQSAGRFRFRRTTPAGSARRPPASQPGRPGHGQELPVLVRLAELLRDHQLQPQHPLAMGCPGNWARRSTGYVIARRQAGLRTVDEHGARWRSAFPCSRPAPAPRSARWRVGCPAAMKLMLLSRALCTAICSETSPVRVGIDASGDARSI